MSTKTNVQTQVSPVYSEFSTDPDFEEILELFVASIPEKKQTFRTYYHHEDWSEIRRHAHQLKGSGGGYGFDDLSVEASNLERACQTRDIDQIGQALDSLLNYMDRISV